MSITNRDRREDENGGELDGDFEAWEEVIEQAVDQGDLEEFFDALGDIQAMDPDERFTESADRLHAAFVQDERGDVHRVVDEYDSSPISREMYEAFDEVWALLQRAILQQLQRTRENEIANLLLAIYLHKAREAFVEIDRRIEEEENIKQPVSTFIALSGRLLQIVFFEEEGDAIDLYHDVLRADFYLSSSDSVLIQHPDELSDEEVREKVLLEGALLAYEELDISVDRGAELAGVQLHEFEEELERRDIRPDYGPENLDDLVDESSAFSSTTEG